MSKTYKSIAELVGKTPLVELEQYNKKNDLKANIFGKLEYFNPTGSIKDRIALQMILDAEEQGLIKPGDTILDNTSGNTGIALAAFGTLRGYKVVIAIEPGVSQERSQILRAYGAELKDFTEIPGALEAMTAPDATFQSLLNPMAAYAEAQGYFYINQCANAANVKIHHETTGPEIWDDLDGKVDIFVFMSGTNGTMQGAGGYLKEKNPDVKLVLVQPDENSFPAPGKTDPSIDGIMRVAGVPDHMTPILYQRHQIKPDEIIIVSGTDAYVTGREIAKADGIFVGESSAAALYAATELAKRPENEGKNIVVVMADGGMKYLSKGMFS